MLIMPLGAKRISSRMTSFTKRAFPVLWFGLLILSLLVEVKVARQGYGVPLVGVLIPLLMMGLGYFLFKKLIFDLMDEVWDDGNELIVVNDGHVERIALSNIMNVSYSGFTNPKRITLTLRQSCRWGGAITFTPPARFMHLALMSHPVADDLIQRVDQARH